MSNGLDSLDAQRRRGRPIPPPTHKPRETPVELREPPAAVEASAEPPKPDPVPVPASAVSDTAEVVSRRTIHLGPRDDNFLESVFMAGRQDPDGKFDASRSSVVRLALARLANEMSPTEVVAALKKQTPKTTPAGGRPRR